LFLQILLRQLEFSVLHVQFMDGILVFPGNLMQLFTVILKVGDLEFKLKSIGNELGISIDK
jgi:hypothetical protein